MVSPRVVADEGIGAFANIGAAALEENAPNSGVTFSPTHGVDFYALGLQIAGVASLIGSVNLIVTVLNMRAPGMTLFRMPVFAWMTFVASFLLLFAMPIITTETRLLFERLLTTTPRSPYRVEAVHLSSALLL